MAELADTIMFNHADWSVQEEIRKRVERESWIEWAQKAAPEVENNYKPQSFELSETAKYVFGKGISKFVHSVMP
jgi:hypothetical protein